MALKPSQRSHTLGNNNFIIDDDCCCCCVFMTSEINSINHKCREKEPIIYEGDLMDEEGVLDFLTSLEAMDLPDRIEEVNGKILAKIVEDTDYVAVLFCKYKFTSNKQYYLL